MPDLRSLLNGMGEIINLDGEKPDHIPQEQWDRAKECFDEICNDEERDRC